MESSNHIDAYLSKSKINVIEYKISINSNVDEIILNITKDFQKNYDVRIMGLNSAISKVVLICEILKTKINGIHQLCNISSLSNDENNYNCDKLMPRLDILLSLKEPDLKGFGYQSPSINKTLIDKIENPLSASYTENK